MFAMICGFLFLQSCLDPIELDVPKGQSEAVVVQGVLVKEADQSYISVTVAKVFTFDGSSNLLRVKYVNLINESGDEIGLDFVEEGVYFKTLDENDGFGLSEDLSYRIILELFDGRVIESKTEQFGPAVLDNEIYFALEPFSASNNLENSTTIDNNTSSLTLQTEISNNQLNPMRFQWQMTRTQKIRDKPSLFGFGENAPRTICYYTVPFRKDEQILFNGFESSGDSPIFRRDVFTGNINESEYIDTMYFTVSQRSLSEGAYNYFERIGQSLALTGSMFDPPAGKIRSNLFNVDNPDEEVFGYFYATQLQRTNVMFDPGQFDIEIQEVCTTPVTLREAPCGSFSCCACVLTPNATTRKPDFWGR